MTSCYCSVPGRLCKIVMWYELQLFWRTSSHERECCASEQQTICYISYVCRSSDTLWSLQHEVTKAGVQGTLLSTGYAVPGDTVLGLGCTVL